MPWQSGQRLFGDRYRIEQKLGEGGFGVTYRALHCGDRHPVVIKTLKDELLRLDLPRLIAQYQQQFQIEALRLAICHHPHVVKLENAFLEGDFPCIVMEYIAGESLWQRVLRQSYLSHVEALSYIQQIGSALSRIHEIGFLHRDVKPHNIMVRDGGQEAVLIDFGLAKEFVPHQTTNPLPEGTDAFSAWEQFDTSGRVMLDERSDLYALAATLYYLVTTKVPDPHHLRKLRSLKPPQAHNPAISDRLNRAIMHGMEYNLEDRPRSVHDWLQQLQPDITSPQRQGLGEIAVVPSSTRQDPGFLLNLVISVSGQDYSHLRDWLLAGQWQKADQETKRLLRMSLGEQTAEEIGRLPCDELLTINQLWLNYSDGHFGYSVQKRLWQQLGGKVDASLDIYLDLANKLKWRDVSTGAPLKPLFSTAAPIAHLPAPLFKNNSSNNLLFYRFATCNF